MKSGNSFDDIIRMAEGIRKGEVHPIYVFAGDEDYLKFHARQEVAKALEQRFGNIRQDTFDGGDITMHDVIMHLNSPSLFEPFRLVIVRSAPFFRGRLPKPDESLFSGWLQRNAGNTARPTAVLICLTDKIDRRLTLMKQVKKHGTILVFPVAPGYEKDDIRKDSYYPVARTYLESHGKTITERAWLELRKRLSNNLWSIMNALDSLIAFAFDEPRIDVDAVETLIAPGDDLPVFSITEALGDRNPTLLRANLEHLLSVGTAPLIINKLLSSRIRNLILAKSLLEQVSALDSRWMSRPYWEFSRSVYPRLKPRIESDAAYADTLGTLHPYALFLLLKQSGKFELARLKRALLELSGIDKALKSTGKSPLVMFEMALLPLCA